MPDLVNCETRDFDRTLFSEDRERAFEIRWACSSRRFNDSQRTIAELERCDRGVFRFDLYKRCGRACMNAHDIAKKPFQHIDMMTGLVSENTAVTAPGAAPLI